jgi:hypothetical protein
VRLSLLKDPYAICRLASGSGLPEWIQRSGELLSVTVTPDEVSIVCPAGSVPGDVQCDLGWAALKVEGPLPLQMSGVLASLVGPLADADVPVFAVSTFDTDYLLVKQDQLPVVKMELERFGHSLCMGNEG